jgi:flagellar basal-body rod protein FlgC
MDGFRELFSSLRVSSSGLSAERARIDVIARNIANARVTRTPDGGPYTRQVVNFEPILQRLRDGSTVARGVRVSGVHDDAHTPFEELHDPSHPDADANGMVRYPNVETTREMADLITAMRAYEANLESQRGFVRMAERALQLAQ